MRCPFCSHNETQVKDSRPSEDNGSIRRRRECEECGARFTTFERVQLRDITVLKVGDRRQPFDRDKLIRSFQIALRKRPVEMGQIEKAVSSIVRQVESMGEQEITSARIGEMVMKALARMDTIAYIRFASVYRDFRKPEDFNDFLEEIEEIRGQSVARRTAAE
jgi:transcriptional repressor NrdR